MTSIARQRLFSVAKAANRHLLSPAQATHVFVRTLGSKSGSFKSGSLASANSRNNNEKDVPLNNSATTTSTTTSTTTNNNNHFAQEAQQLQSEPPQSPLPEFAVGNGDGQYDWSRSYFGLSTQAFSREIVDILVTPIDPLDIEIKPDGLLYLPEIKYRRILNKAFGPGGWGLAPRSETNVGPKVVSREYALVCQGRLVAIARGEQEYFDPSGIPTATEGCKSNALMRCSKDLGIASELWDPRFIREFKEQHCTEVFVEHLPTKKKKKLWRRKDQPKLGYPYQE